MSASPGQTRYWLLNTFGRFLELDHMRDCLFSRTLDSTAYPGIFFFADDLAAAPFDIELRKIASRPSYMRSQPDGYVKFDAPAAKGWERYLPVDETLLHALIILAQPAFATLVDTMGIPVAPLTLAGNFQITLGTTKFPLLPNIEALGDMAHLPPGEEMNLHLTDGRETASFVVRRH